MTKKTERAKDTPVTKTGTDGTVPYSAEPASDLANMPDRLEAINSQRDRDRAAATADAWSFYSRALTAVDPSKATTADLAAVCEELGISPDQMRRDLEIIAGAREWQDAYDRREECDRRRIEARQARVAVQERHEAELKKARQEERRWESGCTAAQDAQFRLTEWSRERPELFDTSVSPPRLREG
jgi:hypothetical protein